MKIYPVIQKAITFLLPYDSCLDHVTRIWKRFSESRMSRVFSIKTLAL
jgi:hypothetical protein